jgi:predicted secreted protein
MTISNTKYTGRTLYLMVEVSAGVYAQVGGLRADSLSIGNEEIDITDKSDDTWKKLLAGGNRTLGVSGSGFVTNNTAFEVLQSAANAGTPLNAKLVYKAGKAYAAPFLVTSCELNGEYNGAQQFSASLSSMNTPYIGIAGAVPTLDLNFAETGSIQPNIGTATMTHTRSTAALYRDVDGYLKSAAANVPRFEHDSAGNRMGYLPEPVSTNLLLRSQEFDNASWGKTNVTVTADAAVAPDGTATADKVLATTAAVTNINQSVVVAATQVTYSLFVKKGSGATDANQFQIYNNTTPAEVARVSFNYDTGVATIEAGTPTVDVQPYRDGWFRLAITVSAGITSGNTVIFGACFYGASETANEFAYAWGAQVEVQPQTTSYIVTTTASVTRGADVLTYTGITGLSTTEGALVVEFYEPATGTDLARVLALNDNTTNEHCLVYRSSSNGLHTVEVLDGGVAQAGFTAAALSLGALARIAVGFKANDFAASFQGAAAQTDAGGTMFTPNQLQVGHETGAVQPGRPIKRVTYYATKPSNADIAALAA